MKKLRWIHFVMSFGALLVVGAISLSDRLVPAVSREFTDGSSGVTSAARDRVSLPFALPFSLPDLPVGWDTLTHFVLWMGVGVVSAGFIRKFYQVVWLGIGLFLLSGFVEYAQSRWTSGRAAELTDLVANGLGIAVGLSVGLLLLAAEFLATKCFTMIQGLIQRRWPAGTES